MLAGTSSVGFGAGFPDLENPVPIAEDVEGDPALWQAGREVGFGQDLDLDRVSCHGDVGKLGNGREIVDDLLGLPLHCRRRRFGIGVILDWMPSAPGQWAWTLAAIAALGVLMPPVTTPPGKRGLPREGTAGHVASRRGLDRIHTARRPPRGTPRGRGQPGDGPADGAGLDRGETRGSGGLGRTPLPCREADPAAAEHASRRKPGSRPLPETARRSRRVGRQRKVRRRAERSDAADS